MASDATERFRERARDLGLDLEVHEFPAGTRTAADAAEAIGCDVGQIVKSLVFIADDGPVLALTSGANRVDEEALAAALGATAVRKADAQEVRDATGYAIGGTPPFGHDAPIRIVCDDDLLRYEQVWAAAGTASSVFPLDTETLLASTGATVAPFGQ